MILLTLVHNKKFRCCISLPNKQIISFELTEGMLSTRFFANLVFLCATLWLGFATVVQSSDRTHMRRAIGLAGRFLGKTRPNPCVGSVILDKDDNVVSEGAHAKAGQPHAEAAALKLAGERARNGTAYVTLEPCNHFGRTPPCTQALIRHGVRRVVVGMVDPDPRVAGSGIETLRKHGIQVDLAGEQERRLCEELNTHFLHRVREGRPHCTVWCGAEALRCALCSTRTGVEVKKDIQEKVVTALAGVDTVIVYADQLHRMAGNAVGSGLLTVLPSHVSVLVVPTAMNNSEVCNISSLLKSVHTMQQSDDRMWHVVNPHTDTSSVESILLAERVHSSGANITLIQQSTATTATTPQPYCSNNNTISCSHITSAAVLTLPTILHTAMTQLGCNGALLLYDNPAQLSVTAGKGYLQRLLLTGKGSMCLRDVGSSVSSVARGSGSNDRGSDGYSGTCGTWGCGAESICGDWTEWISSTISNGRLKHTLLRSVDPARAYTLWIFQLLMHITPTKDNMQNAVSVDGSTMRTRREHDCGVAVAWHKKGRRSLYIFRSDL